MKINLNFKLAKKFVACLTSCAYLLTSTVIAQEAAIINNALPVQIDMPSLKIDNNAPQMENLAQLKNIAPQLELPAMQQVDLPQLNDLPQLRDNQLLADNVPLVDNALVPDNLALAGDQGAVDNVDNNALLADQAASLENALPADNPMPIENALAVETGVAANNAPQVDTAFPTTNDLRLKQILYGEATFSQEAPNRFVVTQLTQKLALEWDAFDIPADVVLQFIQPSADAIAMNFVTGGSSSIIDGRFEGNGKVALINESGINTGRDAVIDANSVILSTLNISVENFISDSYRFAQPEGGKAGHIRNEGTIRVSDGGMAALVAPSMANAGQIQGRMSKVVMGAGEVVAVDFYGDKLVSLAVVEKGVTTQPVDHEGKPVKELISNTGVVKNEAGNVLFTVQQARGVVDNVINNEGIIDVSSVREVGGTVILDGGTQGEILNSGEIKASSVEKTGGSIGLFGEAITVDGKLDASAPKGGGEVLVGGNFQGKSAAEMQKDDGKISYYKGEGQKIFANHNSKKTIVSDKAYIAVDAREGRAGKVVVWSDNVTHMKGAIDAQGQRGGFVEVSAKEASKNREFVFAPRNKGMLSSELDSGALLLDPKNINIVDPGADAYNAGVNNLFANDPGGDLNVTAATLEAVGANIILQANNDISVTDALDISGGNFSLTLQAGRTLTVGAAITAENVFLSANDNDADAANRDANPGNLTINDNITAVGLVTLKVDKPVLADGFAAGDITQGGGVITAAQLTVTASGNVNIEEDGNNVHQLNDSTSGGIFKLVNKGGALITGKIDATDGGDFLGGGTVTVDTEGNALTLGGNIDAGNGGVSDIFLLTDENIVLGTSSLTAGRDIALAGLNITGTGNLITNTAAVLGAGHIEIQALGTVNIGSSGTIADELRNSTSGGSFTLRGQVPIINAIDTTAGAVAAGGSINIDSQGAPLNLRGNFTMGNGAANDIALDSGAADLDLDAVGGLADLSTTGNISLKGNNIGHSNPRNLEITGAAGKLFVTGSGVVDIGTAGSSIPRLGNSQSVGGFTLRADGADMVIDDVTNTGAGDINIRPNDQLMTVNGNLNSSNEIILHTNAGDQIINGNLTADIIRFVAEDISGGGVLNSNELRGSVNSLNLTNPANNVRTLGVINMYGGDFTLNNQGGGLIAGTFAFGGGVYPFNVNLTVKRSDNFTGVDTLAGLADGLTIRSIPLPGGGIATINRPGVPAGFVQNDAYPDIPQSVIDMLSEALLNILQTQGLFQSFEGNFIKRIDPETVNPSIPDQIEGVGETQNFSTPFELSDSGSVSFKDLVEIELPSNESPTEVFNIENGGVVLNSFTPGDSVDVDSFENIDNSYELDREASKKPLSQKNIQRKRG